MRRPRATRRAVPSSFSPVCLRTAFHAGVMLQGAHAGRRRPVARLRRISRPREGKPFTPPAKRLPSPHEARSMSVKVPPRKRSIFTAREGAVREGMEYARVQRRRKGASPLCLTQEPNIALATLLCQARGWHAANGCARHGRDIDRHSR